MATLQWAQTAPGVWKAEYGTIDSFTPLRLIEKEPKRESLARLGEAAFPFAPDEGEAERNKRGECIFRLPLDEEERLFGLGLQFMKINQRGQTRFLRVNSNPNREDTGATHAPVPFYISSRGYGVLIDTARIVTVYCGSSCRVDSKRPPVPRDRNMERKLWRSTPLSDAVEVVVPDEGAEIYVFAGRSMLEVVQRYNLYCGGGTLPPQWGLGFWHRVPSLYNAEQVAEEAMEFRKREFPCDVIGLEPGWHSKSYPCTYEWSKDRYPEPRQFVERMAEEGFHINLWENPYVSPEAGMYEGMKPLSGSHSVWAGLAPDYSLPEARAIYMKQHTDEHIAIGISGYKLDECDGSELTGSSWMFPPHAEFPSGRDGEQLRQVYGLLIQKMADDMYRAANRRTYGLVRASTTGASSFPSVLYSDLYDHRQFVRALCNSSFSGLLWTPEVRKAGSAEEWVRRMQVVCFSPLAMLNAWSDGTKPWSFPEVEPIIRKYIQLRMQLIPYLYSAFARYHHEGIPPFRAMQLESGPLPGAFEAIHDNKTNSTDAAYGKTLDQEPDDQFMVGDSLLVAPLFAGETARDVYLPEGRWYDFETGECYQGGGKVRVEAGLEKIPVFVRDGGIIPLMPALPHVPAAGEAIPLEVRHYGEAPGTFLLYEDDGETFAYEDGQFSWTKLEVEVSAGRRTGIRRKLEGRLISKYGEMTWKFMNEH